MHPRNRHAGRYDFARLTRATPALARFVRDNGHGDASIDFADPLAVKALNQALLKDWYGVEGWDIPPHFLCPPIPGRADYLHTLADLLGREPGKRLLDVGTGANCIYPIIGVGEYGWRFVGSEVDAQALESGRKILAANPKLAAAVELRLQPDSEKIFEGVIRAGEHFDATLCNPPFHSSKEELLEGSLRKWRNLGKKPAKNFGGQASELWTPGGEVAFVSKMAAESARFAEQVGWFTSLVSKETNLPAIYEAIEKVRPKAIQTADLFQGQKKSRIVAWSFG